MSKRISICISTWCRKDYLREIIHLLQDQTIPQSDYEIIVCDSYSPDGTKEVMEELCKRYSNIRYLNTKKNVLAVKRNMGIRASESPIVVFMDDDVFPTNHFVEAHLSAHEDTDGVVFCGQIRFQQEWVKRSNYYRYRDDCHLGEKDRPIWDDLPFNKIVVMNLSFKKDELLNKVGFVDERFIGYGGEDTEFGYRITKSGLKLVYLEKALAYHYEKSPSIVAFGEKIFRSGRDGARTLNDIDPNIVGATQLGLLDSSTEFGENCRNIFKKKVFNLLVNKPMANLIAWVLVNTDNLRFCYNHQLYRYYLAYRFKEGVLAQRELKLTLDDVKTGWYDK